MLLRFAPFQESVPNDGAAGAAASTPSLEDTIAANYDAMMARGEESGDVETQNIGNESDDADSQGAAAQQKASARARGSDGKFAKAGAQSADAGQGGEAPDGQSADKDGSQPGADTDQQEAPAPLASKFADPPKSWNAQEKAAWGKVPEEARAAMHRREQDFFNGLEQYRGKASHFDALHQVIAPHAEIFKASGQNAIENIGGLLNLQRALYSGDDSTKVGTLLQIASNVGIQPAALIEALQNPQSQPVQDPRYDTLSRELQETRAMLGQIQSAPVVNQVQAFLADPKNEFLGVDGVRETMQSLLNSGVAKSLQEAYDKACRLNDTVVATQKQRQAEADAKAAEAKQKEEAKRKADLAAKAAKAASINVRPRGVTTGTPTKKGTLEETIGATWDAIAARQGGG